MKKIINIIDGINNTIGSNISLIVPFIGGLLVYEIIRRYVFNSPSLWVHDTSQLLFGVTYMMGASYTLLKDGHVNMDILYRKLSYNMQLWINIFNDIIIIGFVGVLVWKSFFMAYESFIFKEVLTQSGVWEPPIWPIKIIFFIGCILFLTQAVSKIISHILMIVESNG